MWKYKIFLIFFLFFFPLIVESSVTIAPIKVTFQQPTYLLEKDIDKDTYTCDSSKWDCKVNLDLTSTFWKSVPSIFSCLLDFWFSTGEEQKCNPNTVIFPVWNYSLKIKIFEKLHPENFQMKSLTIINSVSQIPLPQPLVNIVPPNTSSGTIIPQSQNGDSTGTLVIPSFIPIISTGSSITSTGITWVISSWFTTPSTPPLFIPDIILTLQIPSYISLTWVWSKDEYTCDSSKNECKVNFNLEDTFWGYISTKFACKNDFWWVTGEEQKCNPNTIVFPSWEYHPHFEIFEKSHPENKKEKTIFIHNISILPPELPLLVTNTGSQGVIPSSSGQLLTESTQTGASTQSIVDTGTILPAIPNILTPFTFTTSPIPQIIFSLQSPSYILEAPTGGTYICDSSKIECKVNFNLEDTFWGYIPSKFACVNDFGRVTGEELKCNPNTVVYPEWEFDVHFKIFEKDIPSNFQEKQIHISNVKSKYEVPHPIIEVQSGLDLQSEIYECKSKDCKVNLTGEPTFTGSMVASRFSCLWDFGSGSFDTMNTQKKCNPGFVAFPLWQHTVSLTISDIQDPSRFQTASINLKNGFIEKNNENIANMSPPESIIWDWVTQTWSVTQLTDGAGIQTEDILPILLLDFQEPSYITPTDISDEYTCDYWKSECKVNFDLRKTFAASTSSKYSCQHDFWFITWQEEKCNPGTIIFPEWEFHITFSLFEKLHPEIKMKKNIIIHNAPPHLEIPTPEIAIQSGLHIEGSTYTCTSDACKVNFSALKNLTWSLTSENILCSWSFSGSGETLESCNPGYLTFWAWKHEVTLKIFEKKHPENYSQSKIQFQSIVKEMVNTSQKSMVWWDNSKDSLPEERGIEVQSGLIVENNIFVCETLDCKVNFKFSAKTHETCQWDFWNGVASESSSHSCNPTFVKFPFGEHTLSVHVTNEVENLQSQFTFSFSNPFLSRLKSNSSPVAKISLDGKLWDTKILQGNILTCITQDNCSVNFSWKESYDPDHQNLSYFWEYGDGTTWDEKNPKTKVYQKWNYTITLKVSDGLSEDVDTFFLVVKENMWDIWDESEIFSYLKLHAFLPNPKGRDDGEWIELTNTWWHILNLKNVIISDAKSKKYTIPDDTFLFPHATKRFYKSQTKISLKNEDGKVELWYQGELIDTLSWSFKVKDNYVITRENLLIESQKVKVISVIDGDTIVIQFSDGRKEKLRFIGVDTPETVHPKKPVQAFGKEASLYVATQLTGKEVYLEIDTQNYRDKYDRLLGYIRFTPGGETFNQMLIEKGYGRAYLFYPFMYSEDFKKSENFAKKNKLWLWAIDEVVQEMKQLEKEDKKILKETENNLFDVSTLSRTLFSLSPMEAFSIKLKNSPQKMLFSLFENDKKISKKYLALKKPKKEKIPFSLQVTLLKSWLKITGKTLPNTFVEVDLGDNIIILKSDSEGKFQTLKSSKLPEGDTQLQAFVLWEKQTVIATKTKQVVLTWEYIQEIQAKSEKIKSKKPKGSSTKSHTQKPRSHKKTQVTSMVYSSHVASNFQNNDPKQNAHQDTYLLYILLTCGAFICIFTLFPYKIINVPSKQ